MDAVQAVDKIKEIVHNGGKAIFNANWMCWSVRYTGANYVFTGPFVSILGTHVDVASDSKSIRIMNSGHVVAHIQPKDKGFMVHSTLDR